MFLKLDCFLRGIWRTIKSFIRTGDIVPVCGCNMVEEEIVTNVTVTILKCEDCGNYSVGWEKRKEKNNANNTDYKRESA